MELFSQLVAVAAVLGLTGGAVWLLKRGSHFPQLRRRANSIVEVVDQRALSPQLSIHVVRVREVEYVIAAHVSGVTVLKGGES